MLSNAKNYFSFFGILASCVNAKLLATLSTMKLMFKVTQPKIDITTALLLKQPVLVQNKTQKNN